MHLNHMIKMVIHVKHLVFDFGDGSPPVESTEPVINHVFDQPGTYPVNCTVTDKYGNRGNAALTQKINDPLNPFNNIGNDPTQDPYVAVSSTPPTAKPREPVTFDASKSHDMDGDPCKNYTFDFGDGSPIVHTPKPVVKHQYDEPGTYPVKVIATDKYGKKGDAKLNQLVTDPKNPNSPLPPYANVISNPSEAEVKQPVQFDASKSHDQFNKPCVQFEWDFGDGTPIVTTPGPKTTHPYENPSTYPVKVIATDKNGLSAQAGLNQKVKQSGPSAEDPYAAVASTPPDAQPKEPVRFDASKSHDQDGDPCKTFTWDFGDGTPKKTTKTPVVKHPYKKPNVYPVSVEVTDANGLTGDAFLNQRISDPSVSDTDPSRGGKGPKNKNYEK
eukprot:122428_1